jgi:hypothetical protein
MTPMFDEPRLELLVPILLDLRRIFPWFHFGFYHGEISEPDTVLGNISSDGGAEALIYWLKKSLDGRIKDLIPSYSRWNLTWRADPIETLRNNDAQVQE